MADSFLWRGGRRGLGRFAADPLGTGGEGVFSEPAADVVPVDTTAAGDTFTGFYLMAALNGEGAKRALQIASAASGLAITRMGAADSIPTIGQVQAAL